MDLKYMRQELTDEYGIIELQDKILQLAVYLDTFCKKYNIRYCLMGGSCLGALRHSGFIPWDDDLDVFMTPKEYAKFRKAFKKVGDKQNYYLQELSEYNGKVASAKLRLNNTTYIEEATKSFKMHQGVFIDIFLLHNCPNNKLLQIRQCFWGKYILAKGQSYKSIKYRGKKKILTDFLRLLPKDFLMRKALKEIYRYDKKKTDKVCHFMGKAFYKKGLFDAADFASTYSVDFERVKLENPIGADHYMKCRFGDYMKLPSKESIKRDQHAWKFDVNNDFSNYVNTNRLFDDEKILV